MTKRLSEQPELSKYLLLAEGFSVNYPAAFTLGYHLTCKSIGLGFTDTASKITQVNSKIACLASALAEKKIPTPKPQAIPAKILSLINTVNFKASPNTYKGSCPTTIKFIGSITTNFAGTVIYRYVSHGSRVSSTFNLKFDKKETRTTLSWAGTDWKYWHLSQQVRYRLNTGSTVWSQHQPGQPLRIESVTH
ncbi:hypothetical protein [Shewanella sp.]|uniref:hypothetical protein n=1 Tax=Shewanella sp. TaxID=50422 RepID=UPI001ED58A5F|nr:hypothetical protein [Shewanella sp.]NRB22539.1 hypothetical protein [Shewanella sp.]